MPLNHFYFFTISTYSSQIPSTHCSLKILNIISKGLHFIVWFLMKQVHQVLSKQSTIISMPLFFLSYICPHINPFFPELHWKVRSKRLRNYRGTHRIDKQLHFTV
ncbi:hypothetical protein XELAEV_18020666mg [Xenopus laevis]|uniref:Uncharacterized protein n=1 Tax=Xenopus laevis TaxID=8355 RepID=A0A974DA36_XENLA|nr:hypothetical protein XELAEV_18020666mg [Xenopus laevis]